MTISADFQNIAAKLQSSIVETNISYPELVKGANIEALRQEFLSTAQNNAQITPVASNKSANFPEMRHNIRGLNDAINNNLGENSVRFYAQNVANQLARK